MTIMESNPPRRSLIELAFDTSMETVSRAEFCWNRAGRGMQLTSAMYGDNTFLGKAFSLVMDMDKMLGKDFEQGLLSLKSLAEGGAPPPTAGTTA